MRTADQKDDAEFKKHTSLSSSSPMSGEPPAVEKEPKQIATGNPDKGDSSLLRLIFGRKLNHSNHGQDDEARRQGVPL